MNMKKVKPQKAMITFYCDYCKREFKLNARAYNELAEHASMITGRKITPAIKCPACGVSAHVRKYG